MKTTLIKYNTLTEALAAHTASPKPDQFGTHIMKRLTGRFPTMTHAVLFCNLDFSSSQYGKWTVMTVGPDQTYKTMAEVENSWLNDLPSQRQYPVAYVDLEVKK